MHVLSYSYSANGVHDAEFFSLDDNQVLTILKNHSNLVINLISKFNFHKGLMLQSNVQDPNISLSVEEMDVDSFVNETSNACKMVQNIVENTSVLKHKFY